MHIKENLRTQPAPGHFKRHVSISCSCISPLAGLQTASFSSPVILCSQGEGSKTQISFQSVEIEAKTKWRGYSSWVRASCPAFPSIPWPWRSHEMCGQQTAFPAYHRTAALASVLTCPFLLMEGRVTGEKKWQVDFDVDDIVNSTWQPEVKHQ